MNWIDGKPTEPGIYKIRNDKLEFEIQVIEYSRGLCYNMPDCTYTFELEYLDSKVQHCKIEGAKSANKKVFVLANDYAYEGFGDCLGAYSTQELAEEARKLFSKDHGNVVIQEVILDVLPREIYIEAFDINGNRIDKCCHTYTSCETTFDNPSYDKLGNMYRGFGYSLDEAASNARKIIP